MYQSLQDAKVAAVASHVMWFAQMHGGCVAIHQPSAAVVARPGPHQVLQWLLLVSHQHAAAAVADAHDWTWVGELVPCYVAAAKIAWSH